MPAPATTEAAVVTVVGICSRCGGPVGHAGPPMWPLEPRVAVCPCGAERIELPTVRDARLH